MQNSAGINKYFKLFTVYSFPLVIICIVSRSFPFISFLYYLVPAILFLYILIVFYLKLYKKIEIKRVIIIFVFPVYSLITTMWSLYPAVTLQRSLYLIFLYAGLFSAIMLYKKFNPELKLTFLIPANILVIMLSLFSLVTNIPADSWSGGNGLGFMGFAGHQNTLASAILFTLPGVFSVIIRKQRAENRIKKNRITFIIYFLLLTFNFLLLIITYSRAAILSFFVGLMIYLLLTRQKKIIAGLIAIVSIISVLYFTVQPVHSTVNNFINKDGGKILSRRMILWQPSYKAVIAGGITGLGYGVSMPDIKTPVLTGSRIENGIYIREKGNSVLAIIEEAGWIGLIIFLLPLLMILRKFIIYNSTKGMSSQQFTIKENFKKNYTLYIVHSTLVALLIHSQFEAWWVGVGSVQLPLFLIYLFIAQDA